MTKLQNWKAWVFQSHEAFFQWTSGNIYFRYQYTKKITFADSCPSHREENRHYWQWSLRSRCGSTIEQGKNSLLHLTWNCHITESEVKRKVVTTFKMKTSLRVQRHAAWPAWLTCDVTLVRFLLSLPSKNVEVISRVFPSIRVFIYQGEIN